MAKRNLVPLKETETVALMKAQTGKPSPLALAFGTAGVALIVDKSPWAVVIVAEMRGIVFSNGEGI